MALIKCSECGKDVSDKSAQCPQCGKPNEEMIKENLKAMMVVALIVTGISIWLYFFGGLRVVTNYFINTALGI